MKDRWRLCKLGHFQNARPKNKVRYKFLKVTFKLSRSRLFFYFLHPNKESNFRALLTPWILPQLFWKVITSRVYKFSGCERVLLKELFFPFVTLQDFFGLSSALLRMDTAILLYKVKNFAPTKVAELINLNNSSYSLRNNDFHLPRFDAVNYGKHYYITFLLHYSWPVIWKKTKQQGQAIT